MAGRVVIRRRVPKDNNCLFSAVGYLCEGRQGSVCTELRAEVAEFVKSNPEMSEVMLGMDVEEYGRWIRNEMNWGGETEILCLSKKYQVEVQVVLMGPKSTSLTYNEGAGAKGRIFLLYTGQHYDAVVSAPAEDAMPDAETRLHTDKDKDKMAELDKMVLALGDYHFQEDARKAAVRVKKLLKCSGCGHLCNDTAAFQEHCGEVEHDDDFMYECAEVEVEVEEEAGPDASQVLDLYNTSDQPLATLYKGAFTLGDKDFATLEHCLQFQRYEGDAEMQTKIMQAATGEEAYRVGEFGGGGREEWEGVRNATLEAALRAKLQQVPEASAALLATGERDIRVVGADNWLGVTVASGNVQVTGKNCLGNTLVKLRQELKGK